MKVDIEEIISAVKKVEELNDQSVSFVIHGDGSGAFEDFWNQSLCKIRGKNLTWPGDEDVPGFETLNETVKFILG